MYQKSERRFFDQGSIDGKSEVKLEKCHLVAELKLKMLNLQKVTFLISALPLGDTFQLWTHFSHLWTLGQKSIIQIFDMLSINKFHWNFAPCISGILNYPHSHRTIIHITSPGTASHVEFTSRSVIWIIIIILIIPRCTLITSLLFQLFFLLWFLWDIPLYSFLCNESSNSWVTERDISHG